MSATLLGILFAGIRALPLLVLIIGPIVTHKPARKGAGLMWGGAMALLVSGIIGILWTVAAPYLIGALRVDGYTGVSLIVSVFTVILDVVGLVLLFLAIARAGRSEPPATPSAAGRPPQGPYAAQAQQGPYAQTQWQQGSQQQSGHQSPPAGSQPSTS